MSSQSECTEVEFWHPSRETGASTARKPSRKLYIYNNQRVARCMESLWGHRVHFPCLLCMCAWGDYQVNAVLALFHQTAIRESNACPHPQSTTTSSHEKKSMHFFFFFLHHAVSFNAQKLSVHGRCISFTSMLSCPNEACSLAH